MGLAKEEAPSQTRTGRDREQRSRSHSTAGSSMMVAAATKAIAIDAAFAAQDSVYFDLVNR
jgi:hypothetical protein